MPAQPPFLAPQGFDTKLDPLQEMQFRNWVQQNNVAFDLNAHGPTDYDMRGYYQGLQNGNPMARPSVIDPNDNRPHFPDYYKAPTHERFSNESQWAGPGAPQWVSDTMLAAPSGRVIANDKHPLQDPLVRALMKLK
jgi:hypothetical protein